MSTQLIMARFFNTYPLASWKVQKTRAEAEAAAALHNLGICTYAHGILNLRSQQKLHAFLSR